MWIFYIIQVSAIRCIKSISLLLFDFNKLYIFLVRNVVFAVPTERIAMLTAYSNMPSVCFVFVYVNLRFKSLAVSDIFTEHAGSRIVHQYSDDDRLDGRAVGVRFPAEATDFSVLQRIWTSSGAHPALWISGSFSPGSKWPVDWSLLELPKPRIVEQYLHSHMLWWCSG